MEYVHHGNLRKFLRKCRKEQRAAKEKGSIRTHELTPDQLLNFALGVAKAMKHISDCGVGVDRCILNFASSYYKHLPGQSPLIQVA